MSELRRNVENLLEALNANIIEGEAVKILESRTAFDEALVELNNEERNTQESEWLSHESPVLAALRADGQYVLTCAVKDKKADTLSLDIKTKIIDLSVVFEGQAVFADKNWIVCAEALNHAVKDYIIKAGRITPARVSEKLTKFKISAAAKLLNIGVDDIKTAKGMIVALQRVVDAIIPGLTVRSEDAEMLRLNYSRWGNAAAGVSMAIESNFRKQLTRVLVAIVNEGYSAE